MKLKRITSLIAAASLICSASAFAAAVRIDPKSIVEIPDRSKPGDVVFEDFTSVEEGVLPAGASGGSGSGYVTTEAHNIGGGVTKNCYVIADTDDAAAYSGIAGGYSFDAQSGLVGAEIRYKYIPTNASNWCSFEFQFYDSAGKMFSRTVVASANGTTNFNYGGIGSAPFETTRIAHESWYTLKYIIDFNEKKIDAMLKNEATGAVTQCLDSDYYSATGSTNLKRIGFTASYYGGTYVIDYIRISKETERMGLVDSDVEIAKGCPDSTTYITAPTSHEVAKRINITLDGKYKYTTKAPKADGENVLVTAKNVASIFNLGYYMTAEAAVIKSEDAEFVIAKDGSGIKKNKNAMKLSASCIAEDNQVFIPIKDIAEELGYKCSYDAETNTVVIATAAEEKEAE